MLHHVLVATIFQLNLKTSSLANRGAEDGLSTQTCEPIACRHQRHFDTAQGSSTVAHRQKFPNDSHFFGDLRCTRQSTVQTFHKPGAPANSETF